MKNFKVLCDKELVASLTISDVVFKTVFDYSLSKIITQFKAEHPEYAGTSYIYEYMDDEWRFDFYEPTSAKFVEAN